jgi:protein arginine kinase
MLRWFEENGKNSDVVISSRVRLARNLDNFNFSLKLNEKDARKMVDTAAEKIATVKDLEQYTSFDFKNLDIYQKVAMKERHVISNFLLNQETAAGFVSADENISVMLNEEDHIRIQAFVSGMDMYRAYSMADRLDDSLGKVLNYAYDDKYGYLTTCPSNVGTGMRASYMMHLPALAGNGRIAGLATEIGRFGLVLRGIYGEGLRSLGDIYQISNQVTLGLSEKEIMDNLEKIAQQIVGQERTLRNSYVTRKKMTALDGVYRSYGVLKYARKVSLKDGLVLLSELRLGLSDGLIKLASEEDCSIYQLMIGIQPANLQLLSGRNLSEEEVDIQRSQFIRDNLPLIQ